MLSGPTLCWRPNHIDHNIWGKPQPPAASSGDGDGIDDRSGGKHVVVGLDVQRRRADEPEFASQGHTSALIKRGHDFGFGSIPDRDIGPH